MNIFEHRSSFFGGLDIGFTEDSLLSLFRLAKQIKMRMGAKGYLLDNYLSLIFEALANQTSFCAVEDGSSATGDFQSYFFSLLDGLEPNRHPLEDRLQAVFSQQAAALPYQVRYTKLCVLLFFVADELLTHGTTTFVEEQVSNLNGVVDEIRVQELYLEISQLVGEAVLEELNAKIRQRFMLAPLALVFAQSVNDDLLGRLISRDDETSKQMFQLLLDSIPSVEEV